jgi:Fe-S cluster assembly protein SufD
VRCSHGCTIGELNADQMFYLRSRGIPAADARSMLVRAFLTEALDPIVHAPTRAAMEGMIDAWWQRQSS